MSSTSMCDWDELYNYPLGNGQEPWFDFYQATGHPLIYYAQVQPSFRKSRTGMRKGSPNFFVKAFRWYTQEHHPLIQDHENKVNTPQSVDFSNFAHWLDDKYGQFIQEGQQHKQNTMSEPRKPKKLFASMKRKRPHKEGKKDVPGKSNSCEYITKSLVTASECRRSNIKVVCSDTLGPKKSAMKSISMTSSRIYEVDYEKSIEVVMTEGDVNKNREDDCSCAKTEILTIYENKQDTMGGFSKKFSYDRRYVDVECQCKVPSVAKVDAFAQYDNVSVKIPPERPRTDKLQQEAKICENGSKNYIESCCCSTKTSTASQQSCGRTPVPVKSAKSIKPLREVSCQCSAQYEPTRDVSCQCYSTESVKMSTKPTKSIKEPRKNPPRVPSVARNKSLKSFNECTCTSSFQDTIRAICEQHKSTAGLVKTVAQKQTPVDPSVALVPPQKSARNLIAPIKSKCCISTVNVIAQTSDHSIQLDDEVTRYPFFMKIVRADKLTIST